MMSCRRRGEPRAYAEPIVRAASPVTSIACTRVHGNFRGPGSLRGGFALLSLAVLSAGCAHVSARDRRLDAATQELAQYCDEDAEHDIVEALKAVQRADPLVEKIITGKSYWLRLTGAQVWFAAHKGITAQWLERTLRCHQAHRVLETITPAGDVDPFWLEDGWIDIQVQPASAAFIAQLRGRTLQEAKLINSRAQAFVESLVAQ